MTKVHHYHLLTGFGGAALALYVVLAVFFSYNIPHSLMLQRARHSVVEIYTGGPSMQQGADGGCSGVYLGNGLVLTARHCVLVNEDDVNSQMNALWVRTDSGQSEKATVGWFSEDTDVAVLRVPSLKAMVALVSCSKPMLGQDITIIGHPWMVLAWAVSPGVVSTDHPVDRQAAMTEAGGEDVIAHRGWVDLVVSTALDAKGVSGAPVFDNGGDVIGIVVASIGSFSGFIPTSALCAELPRVQ